AHRRRLGQARLTPLSLPGSRGTTGHSAILGRAVAESFGSTPSRPPFPFPRLSRAPLGALAKSSGGAAQPKARASSCAIPASNAAATDFAGRSKIDRIASSRALTSRPVARVEPYRSTPRLTVPKQL